MSSKRKIPTEESGTSKKRKEKKSFKDASKNEDTYVLPEPQLNADELFVIDRKGSVNVKPTTESWRAKPLKTDLILNELLGKTGQERKKVAKAKKVRGGGAVVSGPPEVRRVRAAGPRDLWAEVKQEEKSAWSEHWRPVTAKERDAARSNALAKRQMYVPPAAAAAAEDLRHGLSYRPDGAAHEDALGAAAAHELLRQRRERELRAQLRPKVAPSNEAAAEQETLAAMVQFVRDGMQVAFDPAERALAPPEKEKSGPKSKKKKKRKVDALGKRTRRQKRKEKLGKQIEHLGLILRKVEKDEEKEQSKVEEKKRRKLEEKSATRKLGRHVFEPQRPAVLLEADLPSSLRTMGNEKPLQGNRVADVFESLQKRNIVAVTKKQKKHKKHPVKRFEKPSEKQAWAIVEKSKYSEFL